MNKWWMQPSAQPASQPTNQLAESEQNGSYNDTMWAHFYKCVVMLREVFFFLKKKL